MERRTRLWLGLGAAVLVTGTTIDQAALAGSPQASPNAASVPAQGAERLFLAQQDAETPSLEQIESGEGGAGEGGGQMIGTVTEFRLGGDPGKYAYDGSAQVRAYADLVHRSYGQALDGAVQVQTAVAALLEAPSDATLQAAREAWVAARPAYLRTEAFQFYAGPVDSPAGGDVGAGPVLRLNAWPVSPAFLDGIIADPAAKTDFRSLARLNKVGAADQVTTGFHTLEYLLWGQDGQQSAASFAPGLGDNDRRRDMIASVAQLLANDLKLLVAAWAPGANNYRASVEAMDQRNAIGRAFNGMAVLAGYEIPLRRIGPGLLGGKANFQESPFSGTSSADLLDAFEGVRQTYLGSGFGTLLDGIDPDLAKKLTGDFDRAAAAVAALDAPYDRFLAAAAGSPERAAGDAAIAALTDLGRDLKKAGNRLGVLVIVPGL